MKISDVYRILLKKYPKNVLVEIIKSFKNTKTFLINPHANLVRTLYTYPELSDTIDTYSHIEAFVSEIETIEIKWNFTLIFMFKFVNEAVYNDVKIAGIKSCHAESLLNMKRYGFSESFSILKQWIDESISIRIILRRSRFPWDVIWHITSYVDLNNKSNSDIAIQSHIEKLITKEK